MSVECLRIIVSAHGIDWIERPEKLVVGWLVEKLGSRNNLVDLRQGHPSALNICRTLSHPMIVGVARGRAVDDDDVMLVRSRGDGPTLKLPSAGSSESGARRTTSESRNGARHRRRCP